ncbi:hypothetical protein DFQ27_005352 [Actinomortierella ambigua]|uniref:RNI-like protein n=1 Tax=Actinomortierella ambigua TaxID=1343610 RepID=A0A9P6UC93_9FUNG|nr:hypothetical protein DFQ27_005352 [Actinomortierella ambigua]
MAPRVPSRTHLRQYAHLIQALYYRPYREMGEEVLTLCVRLRELVLDAYAGGYATSLGRRIMQSSSAYTPWMQLIAHNKGLEALTILHGGDIFSWLHVAHHSHLRSLTIQHGSIGASGVESFMSLGGQLSTLILVQTNLAGFHLPPGMQLVKLECLHLEYVKNMSVLGQFDFIQRCPRLKELALFVHGIPQVVFQSLPQILQEYCPKVSSLSLAATPSNGLEDYGMDTIPTSHMKTPAALRSLTLYTKWVDNAMYQLVVEHRQTLTRINFQTCANVTRQQIRAILSDCSHLVELAVLSAYVDDVIDRPWACRHLESLSICFVGFDGDREVPSKARNLQLKVLQQLSELVHLRRLDLGYARQSSSGQLVLNSLRLTLKGGLAKLATLRSLEHFGCLGIEHGLHKEELRWMFERWKDLTLLRAQWVDCKGRQDSRMLEWIEDRRPRRVLLDTRSYDSVFRRRSHVEPL